jgi:hypothetical protein
MIAAAEPLRAGWAEFDARALAASAAGWVRGRAAGLPFLVSALAAAALRSVGGAITHPLLRMFVSEVHAVVPRVAGYACALVAIGLIAAEFIAAPRGVVMAQLEPEPEWVEVNKPFPAFRMTLPEFEAPRYAIWRHAHGGGRKDVLTFGNRAGATAVIELYRPGSEPAGEPEEMTASLPALRLSGRPVLPTVIDTKFGEVAVEPFTDRAPGGERRCLRFWRNFDGPRLALSGWYCNAGQEMVDRGMIACALDRLALIAAGGEPRIGALFARAELKRTFCGTNSVFVAATPKRNDWIEAARDPRLRGRQ